MFKSIQHALRYLTVTCALFTSLPSAAQDANPVVIYTQMATLGGAMHFAATACGGYTAVQLAQMKQDQQAKMMQSGMSDATFDQLFAKGFSDAELKWKKASKSEQQLACEKMKQSIKSLE